MDDEVNITPGTQCCLVCGRTITDRELHDSLEAPALAAIRAEHPEWGVNDGPCEPCAARYRELIRERSAREVVRPDAGRNPPVWRRLFRGIW